ncbi:MAG: hypothetical protein H6620_06515, partial [Halobacteriovoraceae bacterium]|nr:hypothetical protein [Halobacteriovoraceae bacterium]
MKVLGYLAILLFVSCKAKLSSESLSEIENFENLPNMTEIGTLQDEEGHQLEVDFIEQAVSSSKISYSCYYDTLVNKQVEETNSCDELGLVVDSSTGKLKWDIGYEQAGIYELKVIGSNGRQTKQSIFTLLISDVNAPPFIDPISNVFAVEGTAITTIDANDKGDDLDLEGEVITYDCYYDLVVDDQVAASNVCSSLSGSPVFDSNLGTLNWTPPAASSGDYEFLILASDSHGNTDEEIFVIKVQTTPVIPPAAATAVGWVEASPYNLTNVTANWTPSVSSDLQLQDIIYFTDSSCSTPEGTSNLGLTPAINNDSFTGTNGNTYYFHIVSYDSNSVSSTSACSAAMVIDTTPPNAATALGWSESSPHNATTATASWTKSTSTDVGSQQINYYTDPSCMTAQGTSASLGASVTTHNFTGGVHGSSYYYQISTTDLAGNATLSSCSSVMTIDTIPPAAPTIISWIESTPSSSTIVTASWTVSVSSDVANQRIDYYTNAACTTAEGTTNTVSNGTVNNSFTGSNGGSYYFAVTAIDTAGNEGTSSCSAVMLIDTAGPSAATSLGWSETSPHNTGTVNASWAPSVSGDLATQEIIFYTNAGCSILEGTSQAGLGTAVNTHSFSGTDSMTYYYTITSYDNANNPTVSSCSSAMLIDTSNPLAPTALAWSESTPHNSTMVTATWTVSGSVDVASQRVDYYTDGACTTAEGTSNSVSSATTTNSFTGADGNSYFFTVTAIDNASNEGTSGCSAVMNIDTTAPAAATVLTWLETSPHNSLTINASWTRSVASDLDSQDVVYYTNASCTTAEGTSHTGLSSATATDSFTAGGDGSYYYKVISYDAAGNSTASSCSVVMDIDANAPSAATSLGWTESSPHNAASVTASWTRSVSSDLDSQDVVYYTDVSCSTAEGTTHALGAGSNSDSFSAIAGSYYYKIVSRDNAGNTTDSACSPEMLIDLSPPSAATALGWAETTPHNATTVTPTWTLSVSSDIGSQDVVYYSDSGCLTLEGTTNSLGSAVTTDSFTGSHGTTYSYVVITYDLAGNSTTSSCSTDMEIDTAAPAAATALTWLETSPYNSTSINASWTRSVASDLASQDVVYYTNAACTVAEGTTNSKGSVATTDAFTAGGDGDFYYKIISYDNAGNSTTSSCSAVMTVDTSAPNNATALGWVQSSPTSSTSVDASWTYSTSPDLASQTITYYNDGTCTNAEGTTTVLGNAVNTDNFSGTSGTIYTYTITSQDNAGNTSVSACSSALEIDTPPTANNFSPASFNEDTPSSITLNYNDPDSDQATSCSISNPVNVTVTTACACSTGVCTVGVTGTTNYNGSASFDFQVTANSQNSNTATATLTINPVDDPPVLDSIADDNVDEGVQIVINAGDNSADSDVDGDTISYQCKYELVIGGGMSSPVDCDFGASPIPGLSFNPTTGEIDWTPDQTAFINGSIDPGYEGQYEFQIIGTSSGGSDDVIFVIQVNQIDIAPAIDPVADIHVVIGETFTSIDFNDATTGTDYDEDLEGVSWTCTYDNIDNDTEDFTTLCGTNGFTWNPSTGLLGGSPSAAGVYEIHLTASSGSPTSNADIFFTIFVHYDTRTFKEISLGYYHGCGLTDRGQVYCWGDDNYDQTADGVSGEQDKNKPVLIANDTLIVGEQFVHIYSGGTFSCGITNHRHTYCWGDDSQGQLGNGSGLTSQQNMPSLIDLTNLSLGESFISLSLGHSHACGMTTHGNAYCWGYDFDGQLGDDASTTNQDKPTIVDLTNVATYSGTGARLTSIYAYSSHTCGIATDGKGYCWGYNNSGQLGDGTSVSKGIPSLVIQGTRSATEVFTELALGEVHTCGVTDLGKAYCWGDNSSSQVGNGGGAGPYSAPQTVNVVNIPTMEKLVKIDAGDYHTCAITSGKELYCWGADTYGQLGDDGTPTNRNKATIIDHTNIPVNEGIYSLSVQGNTTCALTGNIDAYCWGQDDNFQVGNGAPNTNVFIPDDMELSLVVPGDRFKSIQAGYSHTCGITGSGATFCWGDDSKGQLGINIGSGYQTALSILNQGDRYTGESFIEISTGKNHNCGITDLGRTMCWGDNGSGQTGIGSLGGMNIVPKLIDDTTLPTQARNLIQVSAGDGHSCGVAANGLGFCWGSDTAGKLGNGISGAAYSPDQVTQPGSSELFKFIIAGGNHSCGVTTIGNTYCWGLNLYGQLGNNSTGSGEPDPVIVITTNMQTGEIFTDLKLGLSHTCGLSNLGNVYCWGRDDQLQLGGNGSG